MAAESQLFEAHYRTRKRGALARVYFVAAGDAAALEHLRSELAAKHAHFELVALHHVLLDRRAGVPDVARGERRNNPRTDRRAIDEAAELFRAFREEEPGRVTRLRRELPAAAFVMGDLLGVIYRTSHGGKVQKYVHEFKEHAAPALLASHDGGQLLIEGGQYRVTDRGIVDARRRRR